MSWRYFATRLHGDGTETVIAPDLPLSDVSITEVRNGPTEISASITPEVIGHLADDGYSMIEKWSTGIYAEEDDFLRGGGILADDGIDPDTARLELDVMGFSGYPNGQPWTDGNTWPPNPYPVDGIEPMDAFREIFDHLQSQIRGDLGIEVDSANIGRKIGKQVAQGEFDTINGPLSFEYEPFLLRDFETHDLGDAIQNLATNTPFEFVDEVSWRPDGTIRKFIRIGNPTLGSARRDIRFVMGENVQFSAIESGENEYADVILGLGAGEGAAMVRGMVYRSKEHRIRRARAVEMKSAKTKAAVNLQAQAELLARLGTDEVTSVTVLPDHVPDMQGIQVGDLVQLGGETPFRAVDMWVRIESKTRTPADDGLQFDIVRSDKVSG